MLTLAHSYSYAMRNGLRMNGTIKKRTIALKIKVTLMLLLLNFGLSAGESALLSTKLDAFFAQSEWPQTQHDGESILLEQAPNVETTKAILKHIAITSLKAGEFTQSNPYLVRLLKLTTSPNDEYRFFAQKMLGVSAYYLGDYKTATAQYKQALETAKLRNKPLEIASIESNLGLVYSDVNQTSLSLKHYLAAQKLYQQFGTDQDKADMLLNLSSAYTRQSRFDTAAKMLEQAASMYEQLDYSAGQALAKANLGVVMSEIGELQSARNYFQQAIDYYTQVEDERNLAIHYGNLGNQSIRAHDFERAGKEVLRGQYYAEKANNDAALLAVLVPFAKWQLQKGDLAKVHDTINQIDMLSSKLEDPLKKADGQALASLYAAATGDYKKAIVELEEFLASHRHLQNKALLQQLEDFEGNFAAQQLSQEVIELKQQQTLQLLEMTKSRQTFAIAGLSMVLLLTAFVAWYIRNLERTAKLKLEKEVQTQTEVLQSVARDLRRSDSVKSQFLANMSHEIRTPLTAILGHAQILRDIAANHPEIGGSVAVIQNQGAHLHELINDILDLSRIEADQLHIQKSDFDLVVLLEDLRALFDVTAQTKGLELDFEHSLSQPFWIREDYVRLKQVLVNLLGNALKFTEKGWVKLSISMSDSRLYFAVEDSGIGMKPEQLEVIFDSFKQGDDSITRRFGGSGLGLSLSRQLTEMMGGDIRASSTYGVGSQFVLSMPLCRSSSLDNDIVSLPSSLSNTSTRQNKLAGTVLVAEDHPENRALAVRFLTQFGLTVIAAENGKEAVELALREYPDVLLLDIQMPELDGLSAMHLLRKSGYVGPIFALTANVLSHEVDRYLEEGFTGHLAKPFDSRMMYNVLAQVLDNSDKQAEKLFEVDLSDLKISFINGLDEDRTHLITLFEADDWEGIRTLCHKLQGAAMTFGFAEIASTTAQFERAIATNDHAHFQDYYLILCDELSQSSKQLDVS